MKKAFWGTIAFLWALIVASVLAPAWAWGAYFQADLPSANADPNLGVHLIIAGKGMEAGDQWLKAAHTQALIFKDRHKHGIIRLISAVENSNSLPLVQRWGYTNIQHFPETMTGDLVLGLIVQNPKIASIDFIGHNAALYGFAMEDYNNRFFLSQMQKLAKFRHLFSPDSFIRLMGCNTGWYLAPWTADYLKVPVAGVMGAADIQLMYSTDEWFFDYSRPSRGSFTDRNSISYSAPVSCISRGGCLRLKAVHVSYDGGHGKYKGTLPFEKYFCGTLNSADCYRRMALSTQYLVGVKNLNDRPSFNDFAETLADQFCPGGSNLDRRRDCERKIMNHMSGAQALPANYSTADLSLTCSFRSCQFKKKCSGSKCVLESTTPAGVSTTFVDELNAYREGYRLWIN